VTKGALNVAGIAEEGGATSAMQVASDLRRRILHGEFAPGQRLKIDDVAALCDVSHMPVRVALQELEAEGVLDLYPHRGAVIRAVDARFVRNMLELRAAVEVMLTEQCARHLDKTGLAELESLAGEFEQAAARREPLALVSANLRFHDAINRVADNPEALRVLGRGRLLIQALRVRYGFGPGRIERVVAEHRALLHAIARKDAKRAGEIARRHCEGARDELLALLTRQGASGRGARR
jgi:DNA-binding GntR family transcriptional regulator